jgi:hypothetical protein
MKRSGAGGSKVDGIRKSGAQLRRSAQRLDQFCQVETHKAQQANKKNEEAMSESSVTKQKGGSVART